MMSWLMSASGMWGHAVENLLGARPVRSPPRLISTAMPMNESAVSAQLADIVAMKYRAVIQKLNKYHELDRSRVKIFKDIYNLLTEVIQQPSEGSNQTSAAGRRTVTGGDSGTLKSGDIDETSGALYLSASALSRLLDNLWTSATLYDRPRAPVRSGSVKKTGTVKGKTPDRSSSGSYSAKLTAVGAETDAVVASTGFERLRIEYDLARQKVSDGQQLVASEVAYLKWASGAATSLQADDMSVALPPRWAYGTVGAAGAAGTDGTGSANAGAAGAADTASTDGTGGTGGGKAYDRPYSDADSADARRFENLYKSCYGAVPVMAELEHCMYDLLDHHALSMPELWAASDEVDAKYTSMGLTIEEIDAYFDGMGEETGNEGGGMEEGSEGGKEVNVFELLDSVYRSGDPVTGGGVTAPANDDGTVSDELRRYMQQELHMPVASAEPQLLKLREHNRDTLERIARVSEKFSPFAFVWAKHDT